MPTPPVTTGPDTHSLAISGKGTQFAINTGTAGSPTYTVIAELKTFTFSGSKNDTEDVTNADSAGRAHEFIVTLLDAGTIKISGNYVSSDTGQVALYAAFLSGALVSFQITLPQFSNMTTKGDVIILTGLVEERDLDLQYDKAITFSASIKISGLPALTPGY